MSAFARVGERDLAADAAARSGDNADFVGKLHVLVSLRSIPNRRRPGPRADAPATYDTIHKQTPPHGVCQAGSFLI